jgi:predicted transcriptional regulator
MSTTSIRLPDDLRERFDAMGQMTGRTRNDLIVQAMEEFVEREMRELAMIQEGLDQLDRGQGRPLDDVVRDFASQGMLNLEAYDRDREHGRQEAV